MNKYPSVSYAELKKVFHDGLCAKGFEYIGFLCTEDEYAMLNVSRKDERYSSKKKNGKLTTADGITF